MLSSIQNMNKVSHTAYNAVTISACGYLSTRMCTSINPAAAIVFGCSFSAMKLIYSILFPIKDVSDKTKNHYDQAIILSIGAPLSTYVICKIAAIPLTLQASVGVMIISMLFTGSILAIANIVDKRFFNGMLFDESHSKPQVPVKN